MQFHFNEKTCHALFYWNAVYISRNCHLSKLLFLWFKWPVWTTGLAFIFGWQRNKILGKRNVFYSASSHKLPKCTHDGQTLILIKTSKTIKICSEKLHVLNLKRIKCWVESFLLDTYSYVGQEILTCIWPLNFNAQQF